MKKLILLMILGSSINTFADPAHPTEDDAVAIVENTVADLESDVNQTLKNIFNGNEKYWNRKNPDFLVFVMDENATIIFHPKKRMITRNCKNLKDINGKTFRADAVAVALKDVKGWVSFESKMPKTKGGNTVTEKTYCQLFKDEDGKKYIVCCDIKVEQKN